MPNNPTHYRAMADRMREFAEKETDAELKQRLLDLAKQYDRRASRTVVPLRPRNSN